MVRIHVGFTDCRGESEVGVPHFSPRYSYPRSCSDSRSWFLPWGVRQNSMDSELLCVVFTSSRAPQLHPHLQLHRFMILRGTDYSPEWFRLLSHCLGRTDRNRRTGGNRSVLSLIPLYISNRLSVSVTDYQSQRGYCSVGVDRLRAVGFILRPKAQGFSLILYNC